MQVYGLKKGKYEIGSIRNKMLRMTIDRVDGKNGVFADIGVTMFLHISKTGEGCYETRPTWG